MPTSATGTSSSRPAPPDRGRRGLGLHAARGAGRRRHHRHHHQHGDGLDARARRRPRDGPGSTPAAWRCSPRRARTRCSRAATSACASTRAATISCATTVAASAGNSATDDPLLRARTLPDGPRGRTVARDRGSVKLPEREPRRPSARRRSRRSCVLASGDIVPFELRLRARRHATSCARSSGTRRRQVRDPRQRCRRHGAERRVRTGAARLHAHRGARRAGDRRARHARRDPGRDADRAQRHLPAREDAGALDRDERDHRAAPARCAARRSAKPPTTSSSRASAGAGR